MKNAILGPLVAAGLALSPTVGHAQEKVQGLICNIAEKCDLEKSSIRTSYRPFKDNTFTDIGERLNVDLHCVEKNGARSTATYIRKDDWEIQAFYGGEKLAPYKLKHPHKDDKYSLQLSSRGGISCAFGSFEIPETSPEK